MAGGASAVGQWDLIPHNSKTRKPMTTTGRPMSTNNARRETLATAWTYRFPWTRGQRCLIPCESFDEPYWGTGKNIWWRFWKSDGELSLNDEAQAFANETAVLRRQGTAANGAFDRVVFATAFKIVMLEGIEVVFIVIALGANGRLIVPASVGALLALVAVIALGLSLHKPLANVPENTLKFGVGVMLSAFGAFWVGEGIGRQWPGADWALLGLIAAFLLVALALVPARRWMRRPPTPPKVKAPFSRPGRTGCLRFGASCPASLLTTDYWQQAR
jgi:uncharacterized membrane protein